MKGCKKRLLTYSDLTLAKAVEVTHSMEVAERDTQEMKSSELTIRKVIMSHSASQTKPCYCCGKEGHKTHSCGFLKTIASTAKERSFG